MRETGAIVVVRDADLASALELALLAAELEVIVHDPRTGLEALPLEGAQTLVIEQQLLGPDPATFLAALRARPWLGLAIVTTDDAEVLRSALPRARRVTILEMPFQAATLIAAVRAEWPAKNGSPPSA